MRNVMRLLLLMGVLLLGAITAVASSLENNGWVMIPNDCAFPEAEESVSEDEASLGSSQQTSNSVTPVKALTTFLVPVQKKDMLDDFFQARQDSFSSDGAAKSQSDCGTRISSSGVTKSPSDCGTRISSSDVKKDTRNAAFLLRAMTSRKSLDEFFDKHGNAIDFPTTPLTSSASNSPLKQSSSCRLFLQNSNRP